MVFRVYIEKKKGYNNEVKAMESEIKNFLQLNCVESLRILDRYDCEGVSEELFKSACDLVFSQPQTDDVLFEIKDIERYKVIAVEYLDGQFDLRADSAEACIQIISQGVRPKIKTAKLYLLSGNISQCQLEVIKKYLINPVESKEADLSQKETLEVEFELPTRVGSVEGFIDMDANELKQMLMDYSLAMDFDDLVYCQNYFKTEKRNPTITELRVIDTYWSDHCRHTTFLTQITNVEFEDKNIEKTYNEYIKVREQLAVRKPITLMDLATIVQKDLKKRGLLLNVEQSEEINACSVRVKVDIVKNHNKDLDCQRDNNASNEEMAKGSGECDIVSEDWLLLFKNETHNHPTEIEPYGGASTCVGGAIRDPLSSRAYVYGAMRVTGAGNPLESNEETLKGKLPQRKIVIGASNGYSSYGNQIGLATGLVSELYHDGYKAKRMEIGAVIGAVKESSIKRERPTATDRVILLGGKTGRDGCGGATGSSKSHSTQSIEKCGAEVQKGNAPEERKIQRLFRNEEAIKLIKRCNDFGAGGVSVAIGELADGLIVELDNVPKKYEGLDGTELAISESQERMAVVVSQEDVDKFIEFASQENLLATVVATVTDCPRLVLKWKGQEIANISREFLDSNGAVKHISAKINQSQDYCKNEVIDFFEGYNQLVSDLNVCSTKGLVEKFDCSIGSGTVLNAFGGKNKRTPIQAMVHKIPVLENETRTCSIMSWGFNPFIAEKSPYHSAYLAVFDSVAKLYAVGGGQNEMYLTFQEYFEKLGKDKEKWGKPLSALLGAFLAQERLGIGAIGGKDSMSGSFESLTVPPTLVSFAVTTADTRVIISPEFKKANNKVYLIKSDVDCDGLINADSFKSNSNFLHQAIIDKSIVSAYACGIGGIAEAIFKCAIGNGFGFSYCDKLNVNDLFKYNYGSYVVESSQELCGENVIYLGNVIEEEKLIYQGEVIDIKSLLCKYEGVLESVYPSNVKTRNDKVPTICYNNRANVHPLVAVKKPKVLVPVFPGTNCEYDVIKEFKYAGAEVETFVVNNLSKEGIIESANAFYKKLRESQILMLSGGFSCGDEPDGSGKFITAFLRNPKISEEISHLLDIRKGLVCGICNGFQALVKLGLVPYGKIVTPKDNHPTLTYNEINRHQAKLVNVRVSSTLSPWFNRVNVGEVYSLPISHGEGRFVADEYTLYELVKNGQIATQYVDNCGLPTYDSNYNPNGSLYAIEAITSADGRVLGRMGHSERIGRDLYKNASGNYDMQLFLSAVDYFK